MKQLSLMTDRELKQLCRKLLDEKSQLVKALKFTKNMMSLYGPVDSPVIDNALKVAGEEI